MWRGALSLILTCLFSPIGQGAEDVRELSPESVLVDKPPQGQVNDAELGAVYGKGEQWPALRPEDQLSVILWDEGKRKVRIFGDRTDLSTYSHSVVQRYRASGLH